jgi:predicted DNA-binding transcriptional regulator AlpA
MSDEQKAFTIREWCAKYDITPPTFYDARKRGETPDEVRIGRTVRITAQADAEWHERTTAAQREAREAAAIAQATTQPQADAETSAPPRPVKPTATQGKPRTTTRTKRTTTHTTKRTIPRNAEAV